MISNKPLLGSLVLLAEDDPDLIEQLSAVLHAAGAELIVRSSMHGPQCGILEALKSTDYSFSVIILDIILPENDDSWRAATAMIMHHRQLSALLRIQIRAKEIEEERKTRAALAEVRQSYRNCLDREGGLKVLQQLDESRHHIRCPIVLLTSRAEDGIKDKCLQLAQAVSGMAAEYLVKPITGTDLLAVVARFAH